MAVLACSNGGPELLSLIVTGYRLDGPGILSVWGQVFPQQSRMFMGCAQSPVIWVPGLSRR